MIHLVALPHTDLTRAYDMCAYSAKVRRLTHMLKTASIPATVYGPPEHECAGGTGYVTVVTPDDRERWFGVRDWDVRDVFGLWDASSPHWREMNSRAAREIAARWQPGDILGLIGGICQEQVAAELEAMGIYPLVWEWGIGYSGVLDRSHRTFESYAWMHHVAGLRQNDDIRFFDTVVPNCFDPADFIPSASAGSYLLFMGRPTPRKGLAVVAEIAKRSPVPLVVAGQPGADIPGAQYVGVVTGQEKAELMAGALALLAPTTYLEPFGGVAVEAMMSGTPVISTDYGAFTETVQDGVTGYRCRTLAEFCEAVGDAPFLDRTAITQYASQRYSLDAGARMYASVISQLQTLSGDGWYSGVPDLVH